MSPAAGGVDTVALLRVDALCAGYEDVRVLDRVSVDVFPGEAVAILGPNGHGKTTLLRTISGLHRPSAGTVQFAGATVTGRAPNAIARRGLAHVPQGDLLFPDMTVLENLLVGAYLPDAWRRRRASLETVWGIFPALAERKDAPVRNLSGGERRMAAAGRALMGNVRLLMLDEPSLGLAPIAIRSLYEALTKLKALGIALLLVEEAADRIEGIADRLYLLDSGRIVREGRTEAMLADAALLRTYLG